MITRAQTVWRPSERPASTWWQDTSRVAEGDQKPRISPGEA